MRDQVYAGKKDRTSMLGEVRNNLEEQKLSMHDVKMATMLESPIKFSLTIKAMRGGG